MVLPQQAILQARPYQQPSSQAPLTWGDWKNPEQLTPVTPFTPSPQSEYVTWHEKIGLMSTKNLTTFLDFKL